jgi:hypothetical protein
MASKNLDHYNDTIRPGDTVTIIGPCLNTGHQYGTPEGLLVDAGRVRWADYYRDRARVTLNLSPNSERGFYIERDYRISDLVRR